MTTHRDKNYKFRLELNLKCSAQDAVNLLDQTVESPIRPWFMTKTSMKGFVHEDGFLVWPNTIFSGLTDIVVTGKISPVGDRSKLSAYARILPPFRWFPSTQILNWISGLTMVGAWVGMVVSVVTVNHHLIKLFGPLFAITCVFNLLQLVKFIQKPELVDMKNRFQTIFAHHIEEQ